MLRVCNRTRTSALFRFPRSSYLFSSASPRSSEGFPTSHTNLQHIPSTLLHHHSPSPSSLFRTPRAALLATLSAAVAASYLIISDSYGGDHGEASHGAGLYGYLHRSVERTSDAFIRILNRMKHTGAAASVLWQSLSSLLSSANHEIRLGFELRVASLLADIAAANESRRSAIVGAGGGAVLDWLLETVAVAGDNCGTQAESARALAYLIADPNVCEAVLGRPHAVPNLLRFIFSFQPQRSKKQRRNRSFDASDSLNGRSMLVTAIMDIVTSNCDSFDRRSFQPSLPVCAETRDIAAAIQVIEDDGMHLNESGDDEGDDGDGGKGLRGIGIKILGETTVIGLSRNSGMMMLEPSDASCPVPGRPSTETHPLYQKPDGLPRHSNMSSAVVPGLWDDLHCHHVAVPFAAWALANWATASELNRVHIQELDQDGSAVMTALMAPERTVKWHGSLVARLLLEDGNLPLTDSVSDWSSKLLSTISHASKIDDIPLAQMALSAFLVSVDRSPLAQKVIMDKGLHLIRDTAKRTTKHKLMQEALAKALELLCRGDMHLSLQESQKWSGTLLSWVFGNVSSDTLQASATKILSTILEDHGPNSVPISLGWLTLLLTATLDSSKKKGSKLPKSDKVKTQIDQSNILSASQIVQQLVGAVVNLAGNQLGTSTDSTETFPLEDLISLEPFAKPFKSLKKDSLPKYNAADSAVASLKGIKALTELCTDDIESQNRVVDFGVLCLLRRFLLQDDYEKLSAIEAYDASRAPEARERASNNADEPDKVGPNDPSTVRVPPTAHIRKHAARLLNILSLLPKVQNLILEDEIWVNWLEECANGKIPGCNDPKIQSYARATLLNVKCRDKTCWNVVNGDSPDGGVYGGAVNNANVFPSYGDMLFLINPEQPHWKCYRKHGQSTGQKDLSTVSTARSLSPVSSQEPLLDVVFVHGLCGGPYKTWRIADDKSSTKSGLVEKIDQEAGMEGSFWPGEWLSDDFPDARLFTLKYKTNLTQWSGASLPLQEVSSMLLKKLLAAGIGNRPVVFVTHSMGGLVVKQMLFKAKAENIEHFVNNTIGVVFYSCPHFGSKLADMPWQIGFVFRPAPSIGELKSGSSRLVELNEFIGQLHSEGLLKVLSFCETKVTPIVEGYGGWALRMEVVPPESAYPGFGELVVLESTDHINSCKPVGRRDPSYAEMLNLLRKLKAEFT